MELLEKWILYLFQPCGTPIRSASIARITEKAEKDIDAIHEYISVEFQEKEIAKNTVKSIIADIATLTTFPLRCPAFRLDSRYRVLFSGSYNIIFEVESDKVNIVSVLPSIIIH